MAEIVGLVSGGTGLASLTLQLMESAVKLKALGKAYKQAPQYLGTLTLEMESYGLAFQALVQNRQAHDSSIHDLIDLIDRCMHLCQNYLCQKSVRPICVGVNRLERMIMSAKFLGRLRTASEEKETLQILREMECAKTKLMLAHGLDFEARTQYDPNNSLVVSTGLRGPQTDQQSRGEARTRDVSQLMNDLLPLIAGSTAWDSSHAHDNDTSEVNDEQVVVESQG